MIEIDKVNALHDKAMELAEQALLARDPQSARLLLGEALNFEVQAARLLLEAQDAEPTRSVLFRSAASLAIDNQALDLARELIASGLGGNPPERIAEELREMRRRLEKTVAEAGPAHSARP